MTMHYKNLIKLGMPKKHKTAEIFCWFIPNMKPYQLREILICRTITETWFLKRQRFDIIYSNVTQKIHIIYVYSYWDFEENESYCLLSSSEFSKKPKGIQLYVI